MTSLTSLRVREEAELNEEAPRMSEKILIVEDDLPTTRMLADALSDANYQVVVAQNGLEGLRQFYSERPDLVILDVMMPKMDGWETLRRIREFSNVPIIMLTAKGEKIDRVRGLEHGADDYLVKPFSMRELKARVRAVLRRVQMPAPSRDSVVSIDGGKLTINFVRREVLVRGERASLTPTEYRLLAFLARNAGRTLPHDTILERVWGYGYAGATQNLKLYIWYLRQKVEEDPSQPEYIVNERGIGYRLAKR